MNKIIRNCKRNRDPFEKYAREKELINNQKKIINKEYTKYHFLVSQNNQLALKSEQKYHVICV